MGSTTQAAGPQFTTERDRLLMEVPWAKASEMRERLAKRGIQATACYEPTIRRAFIEMPGDTKPEMVLAVLREHPALLAA